MDTIKERTSRFSEDEYSTFKALFKDTDDLLYLIRKIYFFGGLTEAEIKQAEVFKEEKVFNVLKKVFLPEIAETDPYGQVVDTWLTLDLKDKMLDDIGINIHARSRTNVMMEEAVARLKKPSAEKINPLAYEVTNDDEENHITLLARNNFITGTSYQLHNLKIMSKVNTETAEDKKTKANKNSSK